MGGEEQFAEPAKVAERTLQKAMDAGRSPTSQFPQFANSSGSDIIGTDDIQMPHYEDSVTPIEKFTRYSLDYSNPRAAGKPEAYERGLGYTKDNADALRVQISRAVTSGEVTPYNIKLSPFGMRYEYRIPVTGPNGNTKNVIAVYQIDTGSNTPRMLTNYLEGR